MLKFSTFFLLCLSSTLTHAQPVKKKKISHWLHSNYLLIQTDLIPDSLTANPLWQHRTKLRTNDKWIRLNLDEILEYRQQKNNIYEFHLLPFPAAPFLFRNGNCYGSNTISWLYTKLNNCGQTNFSLTIRITTTEEDLEYYYNNGQLVQRRRTLGTKSCPHEHPVNNYEHPMPPDCMSIFVREKIETPPAMIKASATEWENAARHFLETWFQTRYPNEALLINTRPPLERLKYVKGFVTAPARYWENVYIYLGNVHEGAGEYWVDCSIDGEYPKYSTPAISDDAFDNALTLEKDYNTEIHALCLRLIREFSIFINLKK